MSRNIIIALIIGFVVIVAGVWLYDWVLGDTQEASGQVVATPLELAAEKPLSTDNVEVIPTEAEVATATQVSVAPSQAAESAPTESVSSGGLVIYQIDQNESQVSFNIFEELRGAPKDVIGATNQIAGEVAVDLSDLSTAQAGAIQINARTLVTDDDRRNQAIRNRILNTDQYEFITFTPTSISGLSGNAEPGQSFTFQMAGNLTVRDVTQPVVFEVSAQVESPDRLSGTATTVIERADYNLIVPDLPFIANVGDEVALQIDFVLIPIS